MESTDQVLKQDGAGRVWTPREQREALLDEFERGGLPATKFAAEIGVKYQTFANWVRNRRKERSAGSAAHGPVPVVCRGRDWVEATVENVEAERRRTLVVHLSGEARQQINCNRTLATAFEPGSNVARPSFPLPHWRISEGKLVRNKRRSSALWPGAGKSAPARPHSQSSTFTVHRARRMRHPPRKGNFGDSVVRRANIGS